MKTKTLVTIALLALVALAFAAMILNRTDPIIRVQAPDEAPRTQPPTQLYPPVEEVNDPFAEPHEERNVDPEER